MKSPTVYSICLVNLFKASSSSIQWPELCHALPKVVVFDTDPVSVVVSYRGTRFDTGTALNWRVDGQYIRTISNVYSLRMYEYRALWQACNIRGIQHLLNG